MKKNTWFLIAAAALSVGLLSYGRHITDSALDNNTNTTGGIIDESTTSVIDSSTKSTGDTFSTEATSPAEGENPLFKNKNRERDSAGSTGSTSDTFTTSDTYNTGNTGSTSSTKE